MLQRSQFVEMNGAAGAAAAAAQEPGAGDAAAAAAAKINAAADADDFGPEQFVEINDDEHEVQSIADGDAHECGCDFDVEHAALVDDAEAALSRPRRRKAPDSYVPPGASPKRAKASADKPIPKAAKCAAKCDNSMLNPRTSAPYKRGPYNKPEVGLAKVRAGPVPLEAAATIKKLRDELAAALAANKTLDIELELEKRTNANNVLSAKNAMLARMSTDAMEHFMRGLNHGSRMSGGIGIHLPVMPSPFLPSVGSASDDN